jgi:hypothetical protein
MDIYSLEGLVSEVWNQGTGRGEGPPMAERMDSSLPSPSSCGSLLSAGSFATSAAVCTRSCSLYMSEYMSTAPLIRTSVIGFEADTDPVRPRPYLITSSKTQYPNKGTFWRFDWTWVWETGNTIQPSPVLNNHVKEEGSWEPVILHIRAVWQTVSGVCWFLLRSAFNQIMLNLYTQTTRDHRHALKI